MQSSSQLGDYGAKRNRARTNEPFGAQPVAGTTHTSSGAFVVHLHDARSRHYDLRLEIGSDLKSFAVPKGPSLSPADKRLAIQTEDHPIEYLDFEAVIPDGNYGAGPMIVWDRGRVRYLGASAEDGLATGKLEFELFGYKLRGRFELVRTNMRKGVSKENDGHGKPQWLLFKKRDPFAGLAPILDERPASVLSGLTIEQLASASDVARAIEQQAAALGAAPRPVDAAHLSPMLCGKDDGPGARAGWIFELKMDGVRMIADKANDAVVLRRRSLALCTHDYPEIARAVRALPARRLVLDGEIVSLDEHGRPSFQRLMNRRGPRAWIDSPVIYTVFDLLAIGPYDLRPLPLVARKQLLRALVAGDGLIRVLDDVADDGQALYEFCRREHLEGMVAKRASAPYSPGPRRTSDWLKIKCERDDDFVVIGWTRGAGGREKLGALELASYVGERLVSRGRVGSGLSDASIDQLLRVLEPLRTETCPADGVVDRAAATFVTPSVVARVRFLGFTDEGKLRQPVFLGVRDDVAAADCTAAPREQAEPAAPAPSPQPRAALTNPGKLFWPDDGITKRDLCEYYLAIADTILRYLAGRPVVLARYPDGFGGKHFYQWNVPAGTPSWVRTVEIEHEGRPIRAFLVDDADTLLYIANLGCIPIHMLAGRAKNLDRCDFVTFDFDLGDNPIAPAVTLAWSLRELLNEIGLVGYPKTSGQSGLHVLAPVGPDVSFESARTLADLVGRLLAQRHPDIGTVERRIENRSGKVFIDTGQTGRSRTIVAPYSVRAHPGATVSTPLSWNEVDAALAPGRFTIFTVPGRLAVDGDPMRHMLDRPGDVANAVIRLERLVRR